MPQNYYLGIDGGGTKTHFAVVDETGQTIAEAFGGSSSIDTVSLEQSRLALLHTYAKLPQNWLFDGIFASVGGIASEQDIQQYNEMLRKLPFVKSTASIHSANDVVGALASGNGELQGMALILGTGSVCFGINHGKKWRSGGYHYKEGDAGSGFDIGFQALKHYARVIDGRLPLTPFGEAIGNHLSIHDFPNLVKYFDQINRTKVAAIAPIVTGFGTVDQYAYKILFDAAAEVKLLVESVYNHLHFQAANLTIVGGLGNALTLYRELCLQNIRKISSEITVIQPAYAPAVANAMIARTNALVGV